MGEIVKHGLVPNGQLSEEAAEARNKHFRKYREGFSRMFSWKACNEDVFKQIAINIGSVNIQYETKVQQNEKTIQQGSNQSVAK